MSTPPLALSPLMRAAQAGNRSPTVPINTSEASQAFGENVGAVSQSYMNQAPSFRMTDTTSFAPPTASYTPTVTHSSVHMSTPTVQPGSQVFNQVPVGATPQTFISYATGEARQQMTAPPAASPNVSAPTATPRKHGRHRRSHQKKSKAQKCGGYC